MENKNNKKEETKKPKSNTKKQIFSLIIEKSLKSPKHLMVKISDIMECICSENTEKLKEISKKGLPDDFPILRSLMWKINLGYLPMRSSKWNETLEQQRQSYKAFKDFFIEQLKKGYDLFNELSKKSKELKQFAEIKTYKGLLEDITKDVNRTHNQMNFFSTPIDKSVHLSQAEVDAMMEERRNCTLSNIGKIYQINQFETHSDIMARILYIYARTNPEVGYCQGMNEILAPIYYVYALGTFDENDKDNNYNIEADTYWSFFNLMRIIHPVFLRQLDEKEFGINSLSKKLFRLLEIVDKEISDHLVNEGVNFTYFAPRWFILLFSQDFLLVDLLRLWDYFFCEENKFKNVFYAALAVILINKKDILESDIADIMEKFQNLEGLVVDDVIKTGIKIEKDFGEEINEIIEEEED